MARRGPDLKAFQHARAGSKSIRFDLPGVDPAAKPCSGGDKVEDKAQVERLARELDELQNKFFADRRFRMLVVLQGTDTSGKDGTLRGVFGQMSALGVRTVSWKAPTEPERARDYLWRIHQQVPSDGEVVIFNRSHYEDVLVPAVRGWLTPAQLQQRYAHINDFERLLVQTGTVICKFMLHISKAEQGRRLQDRLDDPTKHWKFNPEDLEARKHWADYQKAYAAAVSATGTPWAPWTVVPADSKTHRNLMIALLMKQAFEGLKLRFPEGDSTLKDLRVK